MSYIRCLSNPEGLYIWGDVSGKICFDWNVEPPLSSESQQMGIPKKVFYKAVKKWYKNWGDIPIDVEGFKIEEQFVYLQTGKLVNEEKKNSLFNKRPKAFLIKLSYHDTFVFLWKVTWVYVVSNVIARK